MKPRHAFVFLLRARLITYIYPLLLLYYTPKKYLKSGNKWLAKTKRSYGSKNDMIQKLEHFSMGITIESDYKPMDGNLVQQVKENEEEEEEKENEDIIGVPVCGGNLSLPVVDAVNYIGEIHYKIGTRLYIENAD
jgi:hypothetical protein